MREVSKKGRAGQLSKQELKAKLKRIARSTIRQTITGFCFVYIASDYILPGGLF